MSNTAAALSPRLKELAERHKNDLRRHAASSVLHAVDSVCTSDDVIDRIAHLLDEDAEGELLFANGFEAALIGFVERIDCPLVALYDQDKCLQILQERDGMTLEGAREYFDFNVIGSNIGPHNPAFATIMRHA